MPPEIIDVEQNSEAWYAARLGLVTSSKFGTVLAEGVQKGTASKQRRAYMLKLVGERLTGEPAESFSNAHMEHGHTVEPEARAKYAFLNSVEVSLVGFVRNGEVGASPDGFVETSGVLECKRALPHILIDYLLRDEFPSVHYAQCQGQLWVCEREFVDLVVCYPKLPLFVKRAYRDSAFIRRLSSEVSAFNDELAEVVEKVRAYTGSPREETRSMLQRSLAADA